MSEISNIEMQNEISKAKADIVDFCIYLRKKGEKYLSDEDRETLTSKVQVLRSLVSQAIDNTTLRDEIKLDYLDYLEKIDKLIQLLTEE